MTAAVSARLLSTATAAPVPGPPTAVPGTAAATSVPSRSVPDAVSVVPDTAPAVPDAAPAVPGAASERSGRALSAVAIVGGAILAGIGFTGSYNALRDLAFKHGLGTFSYAFPVGIDAGIVVLYVLDLYLIRRRSPWPLLRSLAHLLTVATIVFNAASADGPASADPIGTAMHAVIPVMFVASVEAARRLVVRVSDFEDGRDSQGIPLTRWALSPAPTYALWRRMKLWDKQSYQEVVALEQERTVYKAMLQRRYGRRWKRRAPKDEMLPLTMARYGLTVDEALALPRQALEAEQLRKEQNEALELEAQQRAEERAAAARIHSINTQGDVEAATHATAARVDAAKSAANATRTEAELAAETQSRIAQETAQAVESAEAAEARRRAAEAERAAAEARAVAAETNQAAAGMEEAASEARARAAENARREAVARAELETAERTAAEARQRAAEARERAAGIELRATEAEDAARLTPRERTVRKVARMALVEHDGRLTQLPLEAITEAFGVSSTTASEYRKEAGALIADGYRIH